MKILNSRFRKFGRRFFAAMLFPCALFSQEVPKPKQVLPDDPTVTIHVYSGRRDPECKLSQAEVIQIFNVLDKLPSGKMEDGIGIAEALGYAGMSLSMRNPANKDQFTYVRIYRDHVVIRQYSVPNMRSAAPTVFKRDSAKTLEGMLMQFVDEKSGLSKIAKDRITSGEDVRSRIQEMMKNRNTGK